MFKQPVSLVDFYIHVLTEELRPLGHKHRQFLIFCKTSGQSNTIQGFTMSQFPQETPRRLITTGEELWILENTDLYQSYLWPSHPLFCRRWDYSLLWNVSNVLHGRVDALSWLLPNHISKCLKWGEGVGFVFNILGWLQIFPEGYSISNFQFQLVFKHALCTQVKIPHRNIRNPCRTVF